MSEHATFFNGISWVCPPTASLPAPNRSFVTCRLKLRKRHFGSDGGGGAREEGKATAAKANVTTDLSTTVTAIDDARRAVIYCRCCELCYGRHKVACDVIGHASFKTNEYSRRSERHLLESPFNVRPDRPRPFGTGE